MTKVAIVGLGVKSFAPLAATGQGFELVSMESREDRMVRELNEHLKYRRWKHEFQSKFTRNSISPRNYNRQYQYRIDYRWVRISWREHFEDKIEKYSSTLKLN